MRRAAFSLLAVVAAGCGSELPTTDPPEPAAPSPAGTAFDPARAGAVSGRVIWSGPLPPTAGFLYGTPQPDGKGFVFVTAQNPNRPQVDPGSRAVAGAVVFLRGVNPVAARPWDLPPVAVEFTNRQIVVVQGERRGRVGFVRAGDSVSLTSAENVFHVLRARGDAFFSQTLPEPHSPVNRTLTAPGRVELSSGTGLYWARADLFVTEHPYFTVTDADGRFTLDRVPVGPVEVVVWLPGWTVAKQERDPDSTAIVRQIYSPPTEKRAAVTVEAMQRAEVTFTVP